jgi:hypothetical protein
MTGGSTVVSLRHRYGKAGDLFDATLGEARRGAVPKDLVRAIRLLVQQDLVTLAHAEDLSDDQYFRALERMMDRWLFKINDMAAQ